LYSGRIPTHLEVAGLLRAVEARGGFGTVLVRGERDAGTMLIICCQRGTNNCVYERMPQLDGTRKWTVTKREDTANPMEIMEYWQRRKRQDDDLWVVELDHPEAADLLT
jgi:hypothetical protein